MAGINDGTAATHAPRRGPVSHSDAVQEAKRREKMQTVCSSHRVSGTAERPAARDEAPTR